MVNKRLKEIRDEVLDMKPKIFTKKVSIVFDGKQYNIRIPLDFVKRAEIDVNSDEFEFSLEIPENRTELPLLHGDLVEKEEKHLIEKVGKNLRGMMKWIEG